MVLDMSAGAADALLSWYSPNYPPVHYSSNDPEGPESSATTPASHPTHSAIPDSAGKSYTARSLLVPLSRSSQPDPNGRLPGGVAEE